MRFSFIDAKKVEFPRQPHVQDAWRQPERVPRLERSTGLSVGIISRSSPTCSPAALLADHQRSSASGPGSVGAQEGARRAPARGRSDPPFGPWQPILWTIRRTAPKRHPHLNVGQGQLLRQRHGRDLLQDHQVRVDLSNAFQTRQDAEQAIARYIDGFNNLTCH